MLWHHNQRKIMVFFSLLYQDFTISDLVIRDLLTENITKLAIDSKPLYKRISILVKDINPEAYSKISF